MDQEEQFKVELFESITKLNKFREFSKSSYKEINSKCCWYCHKRVQEGLSYGENRVLGKVWNMQGICIPGCGGVMQVRELQLSSRVSYIANSVGDLDTAARYSRLAVFSKPDDEPEVAVHTCETIIGSMVRAKRHKDAYDLYDYFFNKHTLKPNSSCCNHIIESRLQQGLVDEALDFHRTVKGMVPDYPSEASLRVLTKGLVHSGRFDLAQALLKGSSKMFPDHVNTRPITCLKNSKRSLSSSIADYKSTWDFFYRGYPRYENRVAFLMATFMEYWFKQGKEVEAMECYNQSVLANKLLLCPETGNALLKVLLKYGQKSHARALYNDMSAQSGTLNSDTVQIMANKCFDAGRCSKEIKTYNKARAESLLAYSIGFIPVTTFKTTIDVALKDGRIDDALKTSNKMFDMALKEVSEQFNPL
ncbi:hypothetical protein Bca101_030926 [Brassica carinata]